MFPCSNISCATGSMTQHGEHSTAQHSTAQHSTASNSTGNLLRCADHLYLICQSVASACPIDQASLAVQFAKRKEEPSIVTSVSLGYKTSKAALNMCKPPHVLASMSHAYGPGAALVGQNMPALLITHPLVMTRLPPQVSASIILYSVTALGCWSSVAAI